LLGINGGVVVVATMNHTSITDVIDTVSVIESAQKTVLGVILTD
jgi:Mrp family chromosome partitioning ATPase